MDKDNYFLRDLMALCAQYHCYKQLEELNIDPDSAHDHFMEELDIFLDTYNKEVDNA